MVGNLPNFSKIDILRCFLRFDRKVSRRELAKELGIGEGTVRTILNILKSKKFLDSTKKGHSLGKKGKAVLSKIFRSVSNLKELTIKTPYPGLKKVGILIKKPKEFKELYRLRDIAVKNGADGAIILKFSGGLYAPGYDRAHRYREIERYFSFENGDVLAISFSKIKGDAEKGALSIALELNSTLKKFISEL